MSTAPIDAMTGGARLADARSRGEHRLVLGELDEVRLAAARAPHLSVIQWLIAAGAPSGPRAALTSTVAQAVPRQAAPVLAALGLPGRSHLPDYLIPIAPSDGATVADTLDVLRAAPSEALASEVAGWPGTPPGAWRAAIEDPERWRNDFALAAEAAWAAGRPYWERSRRLLDREISRIGTAAVTGSLPLLLNTLHPRLRYHNGVLRFASRRPMQAPLAGRRLVIVPMLAPPQRVILSYQRDDVALVGYSVLARSAGRPADGRDRLELVAGALRALALRTLARPMTMRELAMELTCAASTATYHCDVLEAAGLIARERRGSAVWVVRTAVGDEFVDLLC